MHQPGYNGDVQKSYMLTTPLLPPLIFNWLTPLRGEA